jgi:opacity protein-like surface antigen
LEQQQGARRRADWFRFCFVVVLLALTGWPAVAQPPVPAKGDSAAQIYARKNTFGIIGAYSWDSSHMLLGDAERRMLVNIGVAYSRRLLLTRFVNWQYDGELLPVALESDPLTYFVNQETSPVKGTYSGTLPDAPVTCAPFSVTYSYTIDNVTYSGTETQSCSGRQWTIGEAMFPVGMQWNFMPARKLQPFIDGHGGTMYTTRPIPVSDAGSFNFTFDIGAGIEIFRAKGRSIRAEYRYHHISNHDTATLNPGIDSGLLQVTYCFRLGRR